MYSPSSHHHFKVPQLILFRLVGHRLTDMNLSSASLTLDGARAYFQIIELLSCCEGFELVQLIQQIIVVLSLSCLGEEISDLFHVSLLIV